MDGELVRQVFAFRDPDRVDLTDQVRDRRVRGGQLLAVPLVRVDPADGHAVALGGDPVPTGPADRSVRAVIYLAAIDHRDLVVQQRDQGADQAALRLPTLAQEDDILPGEDRVLDLRDDRPVISDDSRK